ncbi:TMEM175 family protein [Furfurilactobacillus curtus]|uniref:Membrane protein n=1 Tax=Furfurilactobacillus curtus TaxID=1746200 RepID=A0ABQ5JLE5_9LACO
MNKSRVEAFNDAVIAIILTIMVLEFKTPNSLQLSALTPQFPYLISYAIGYLFIGTAWYNHHFIFSKTKVLSKRIYWANNFWLFATSFIPVATSWVGKGINARGPETFYSLVYLLWFLSYSILSRTIVSENYRHGHQDVALNIKNTTVHQLTIHWYSWLILVIAMILSIIFLPALQMAVITVQILINAVNTPKDADSLFESN